MASYVNHSDDEKSNDSKKIATMIILVLTLMICVTSATYAYFALSSQSNTAITGTAATASLELSVARITPTESRWNISTKKMVPQCDKVGCDTNSPSTTELLTTAMNTQNGCVDSNGNVICQVYKITLRNDSTAKVSTTGSIVFNWDDSGTVAANVFTNLKYRLLATETTDVTDGNIVSSSYLGQVATNNIVKGADITLATKKTLNVGATYYWYIVIWIQETGGAQEDTDKGTFTSTVQFNPVNPESGEILSGVTSTITATS